MPIFTAKKLERGPTLGQKLKDIREAAGVDLEQLAKEMRVRTIHLQRLEGDDYRNLPADVYVRGFLRKYAAFFKADPKLIFEDYEEEKKNGQNIAVLASYGGPLMAKVVPETGSALASRVIIFSTISILILLIGGYFFYQLDFLFGPPKITLFSPKADLITREDRVEFVGKTEPNVTLMLNSQQAYVDREGNFKEEVILNQGLNIIELKAKNRLDKIILITRKIVRE